MLTLTDNRGFALITALMFTLLGLMLTMTLLYLTTAGIQTSGTMKRYHSVTEAAHGGVDLFIKDIINSNLLNAANMDGLTFTNQLNAYTVNFPGIEAFTQNNAACLQAKLTTPRSQWPAVCSNISLGATEASHDMKLVLNSESGAGYNVYAKVVDTMGYTYTDFTPTGKTVTYTKAGNTDLSTVQLEGGGVTGPGATTNPPQPYMYRVEVQASRPATTETSKVSVLYVY